MKTNVILIISFLGCLFIFLGSIGVCRFPDVFCRAHALTKSMTLGISLLLVSMWLYLYQFDIGTKIIIAILFQFITIPLSGHLIGLVAYHKNVTRFRNAGKPS